MLPCDAAAAGCAITMLAGWLAGCREALGGRLRLMLSGGGPLEPATEEFFSTVFCCPITQGYGLTETCAAGTVNWPEDIRPGRVGPPVHCADIRLVDWAEAGEWWSSSS